MKNLTLQTYPLKSISISEAKNIQFQVVAAIASVFNGYDILSLGDLGVKQPQNKPRQTMLAEKAIAKIFNVEAAVLVTGSGTGAIRFALGQLQETSLQILVHDAPVYPTTAITLKQMGFNVVKVDFNDLKKIAHVLENDPTIQGALVQYTRQKIDDAYSYQKVIAKIKQVNPNIKIITDDNYAVFKTGNIGTDFGADLSTFSAFKLQGPEGVGVIIGHKTMVDKIRQKNYSGGSQVQGWQAMEVLRGMVNAPVALAIQAETTNKIVQEITKANFDEIKNVAIVNAQSKVVVIEFHNNIADKFLKIAPKYGMLPHPVGAESKYEITPLFYRISGTFKAQDKTLAQRMIRINPNRSGPDLIIKTIKMILKEI